MPRRRLENMTLFGEPKPKKRGKPPRLMRYDGTKAYCTECDQEADYIINGRLICRDHGRAAIQTWNAIIKGE